jgi:hypothetical protein
MNNALILALGKTAIISEQICLSNNGYPNVREEVVVKIKVLSNPDFKPLVFERFG